MTRDYVWPKREAFQSICPKCDRPPELGCECGIYAFKLHPGVELAPLAEVLLVRGEADAVGKVALWGRVILAERGYRAEFAYPLQLIVPSGASAKDVRSLEEYGSPVELFEGGATPPMQVLVPPPAPVPKGALGLGITRWFQMENSPQPNMRYRWRLPLGWVYRTIELGASAEHVVDHFAIVLNASMQVAYGPLVVCNRTQAGNFLLFDGLRDGTAIDTRKVADLSIEVVMGSVTAWPGPWGPLLVGSVCYA